MRQLKIGQSITSRDSVSLDSYLHDIAKFDMLLPEKEAEVARKVLEGDREAFNILVQSNLRFVVSVAKQYQNQGLPLMDLINEGNLGLIKAAGRFDESKGFKFISYAVWWIRQSILQALAEQTRTVRVPLNQVTGMSKIRRTVSKLQQDLEREPTLEELAEILVDLDVDKIANIISHDAREQSLDAPLVRHSNVNNSQEDTLLDLIHNNEITTDQALNDQSLTHDIMKFVHTLSVRQQDIIKYYFGLEGEPVLTLEDIGEKLHLTRERVRQIKDQTLEKLQKIAASQLRQYR